MNKPIRSCHDPTSASAAKVDKENRPLGLSVISKNVGAAGQSARR